MQKHSSRSQGSSVTHTTKLVLYFQEGHLSGKQQQILPTTTGCRNRAIYDNHGCGSHVHAPAVPLAAMDALIRDWIDDSLNDSHVHVAGKHPSSTLPTTTRFNRWQQIVDIVSDRKFSEQDYLRTHLEYRVAEDIRLYLPMIFVFVGTFGNLLSLIVLLRPRMRTKSTFAFLTVLAVADTAVLYFMPFRIWVGILSEDKFMTHAHVCKFITYTGYVFSEFSAGILVLVTIERFIVVQDPLAGPLMCSVRRAYAAMAVLLAALMSIHMHLFWTVDVSVVELHNHNISICSAAAGHELLIEKVWPWVDILLYSLIPFGGIMTLNALIIRKTHAAGKSRQQLRVPIRRLTSLSKDEDTTRLTFMLLTLTFTFLVTTIPLCICSIVTALRLPYTTTHNPKTHEELAQQELARAVTQVLMFANHSMNFFLYCLTGNKFRQELRQLLCCGESALSKKRKSSSTVGTTLSSRQSSFADRNIIVKPVQHLELYQLKRL